MFRQAAFLGMLLTSILAVAALAAADDLAAGFANPPDSAKPWVYWWWLNGYVTPDAIARDLDEMRRQGISGALVFHAGQGVTPKRTEFMSPEWRKLFRFAVEEAAKRDITIGLNLCGGWNAGGPWVTPEEAAKLLVYRATPASGPMVFDEVLRKPAGADETYRDFAVLAWPTAAPLLAEPLIEAKLTASSSLPGYGPELAMDDDPETRWVSRGNRPGAGPRPDRPEYLDWTFAKTFPAGAVHIVPYPHRGPESWNAQISEVMLLRKGQQPVPAVAQCRSRDVRDLTDKMDPAGRLRWEVPDGHWLVVRFGWRVCPRARTKCTGGARHLEIDPLSAEAMDKHFAATAGVVIEDVGPHVGKTFRYVHIDSGEIGNPDWTPAFRGDFRRLRGYDPFPYLAAKAGQIVDDPATTERFLEDYERTIGDLMIECYYGRLSELARKHGLGTHSEAAGYQKPTVDALRSLGSNDIAMSEFWSRRTSEYIHQLAAAQLCYHDGIRNAASAAHVYGRDIVQAEAFTVMRDVNYDRDPFELKDVGDRAFCAGLNRNMLCFFVCQPEEQSKPGYEWPGVGMEFDRHVTWWPMIDGWLTYLARCQCLLQQGRFVADVCYFQGEWVPAYVPAKWAMDPPLPLVYDCDTINAEVLTTRAAAGEDGRLLLPDGQSYRYLVLWQGGRWQKPPREIFGQPSDDAVLPACPAAGSARPLALSPASLRKLKTLVEGGATLIGPRPGRAIGLTGYPESDAEVKKLADELWGTDPATTGERTVGQGRVLWGRSLAEVIQSDGVPPDLEIREDPATAALPRETLSGIPHPGTFDWIHRAIGGADVYFIANLRNAAASGKFAFRVQGRQPEIWDPVTGDRRDATDFRQEGGQTVVPLQFAPRQSWFVVFRKPVEPPKAPRPNFPVLTATSELTGPWTVKFDPHWGGPESIVFERLEDWTTRPEEGIRYYSGKATYEKTFDLPASFLSPSGRGAASSASPFGKGAPSLPSPSGRGKGDDMPDKRLYLDLGKVKNLAEVRLNGKDLGVVWTAPWRAEITAVVRPTGNRLEIDVINLWPNRLIGDAAMPPEKRLTKTNVQEFYQPPKGGGEHKLLESGLLGPVMLQAAK